MKQKLSNSILDAARPSKIRYLIRDTRSVGLVLKVEPSGTKTFAFEYRVLGQASKRSIIGRYGDPWTLEAARKEAGRLRALVDQGLDPLAQSAAAHRQASAAPAVAELMERTFDHLERRGRRASTLKEYRRNFAVYLAARFGKRKVDSITASEVERFHAGMSKTPYQANRLIALLSVAFNLAERWGMRPPGSNPTRFIERYKEERRGERRAVMLNPAQIGQLLQAIDDEQRGGGDFFALAAIRLAFWTGWRLKSEILKLQWANLDLESGSARLIGTKTADLEYRYLPDEAVSVLRSIPRVQGCPWVFPGLDPQNHRTTVRLVWHRVRRRAGLENMEELGSFREHDLRHNAISWDVSRGVSLKVAGAAVGHKSQQSTEVYAHFLPDHLRAATNARSQAMRQAMESALANGPSSSGA